MADQFAWDVYIAYGPADAAVVQALAERLETDDLRVWLYDWEIEPGDDISTSTNYALERSRVLLLCMSEAAFGSDWARLESHTFRFRDPLNTGRRFIPLRLDDTPIPDSLTHHSYISWLTQD